MGVSVDGHKEGGSDVNIKLPKNGFVRNSVSSQVLLLVEISNGRSSITVACPVNVVIEEVAVDAVVDTIAVDTVVETIGESNSLPSCISRGFKTREKTRKI